MQSNVLNMQLYNEVKKAKAETKRKEAKNEKKRKAGGKKKEKKRSVMMVDSESF